jgi:hypothetical protein
MKIKTAFRIVLYLSAAAVLSSCANADIRSSYSLNGETFRGMDLRDPHFYMDDDKSPAPIVSDPRYY